MNSTPTVRSILTLVVMFLSTVLSHSIFGAAQLPNPILFVTQVPLPNEINGNVSNTVLSVVSIFGNALADTASAGRGGDLMLRMPNGGLVNLTRKAGLGLTGVQHTNGIAVRDPHVYWDGGRALFSMVVGAPKSAGDPTKFLWRLYEITNLAAVVANTNTTPGIKLVENQPANCNNVSPCYGTDDRIIFTSDRPFNGQPHLYPPLDEYKGHPTVAVLYSLDRNTGDLQVLQHVPSGAFNPFIDSFGRLIETRWDHLVQDSNATDDRLGRANNGSFNYTSESSNALTAPITIEMFPEPRNYDTNQTALLGVRGNAFNQFLPWMLSERGGSEELINHWGRQEFNQRVDASFVADATLLSITNVASRFSSGVLTANTNFFLNFLQIAEDPVNAGVYFGVDASDLSIFGGTHSAGQIISITAGPSLNPTQMVVNYVTPKTTAGPNAFGIYRNPLPLSNSNLVAAFTAASNWDTNSGSAAFPISQYKFRLLTLKTNASSWTTNELLTAGLPNNSNYYDGATLVTHSGNFWELQPVEVRSRNRPQSWMPPVDPIEQGVFGEEGVDLATFQADLQARGMALVVSRNVTARDASDKQQPFNLRVPGGTQTVTNNGGKIYDITHLQFLEADYLRGYTLGTPNIMPGRRILATALHGLEAFNLASGKANAPQGGTEIMSDGSQATFVPAGRATTWQLTGTTNESVVKERYWVTFKPGEVRTCANCHGINTQDQIGRARPMNSPLALHQLLRQWRTNAANAYTLTVNNGTGGGNFGAGSILTLTANPPASGQLFAGWTGSDIVSPASTTTQFIMPASSATVTATYSNAPPLAFNLTVVNGSGSGSYTQNTVVIISATSAPIGQVFDQWTGATVADPTSAVTTMVMPGANTVVTSTYKPAQYLLTVLNGSGGGSYQQGTVVSITADAPPAGQVFDQWIGAVVANPTSASTTLTMPAGPVIVTATYKPAPPPTFSLTVNNGTGSGSYLAGAVVSITAAPPPQGQVFDQWVGASVTSATSPNTTLVMLAAPTTVTATYKAPPPPTYTLTIFAGTGSGSYPVGTVVTIMADAAPDGQSFDEWTGALVANSSAASTTLTMPAADTTVTANYELFGVLANHLPAANPQSLNVPIGTGLNFTLTGSDADGDTLSFSIATFPLHGSLNGSAPTLTYTPTGSFWGADHFTFTVTDGLATSAPTEVSLNVVPAGTVNILPVIALTAPNDGAVFASGTDIFLTSDAADTDGTVFKVAFYANGFKISESTTAPYIFTWSGAPAGHYVLTSKAYDNSGARTFSAPVVITVVITP